MPTARKYRLYPGLEQEPLLIHHFGCVRFVYPTSLETKLRVWEENGKSLSRFERQPVIRKAAADSPRLKDVSNQSQKSAYNTMEA